MAKDDARCGEHYHDPEQGGYNAYDGTRIVPAYYVSDRALAGYPVNSKGETYGPDMPEVYGSSPDLIAAMGTNGEEGYVRASELDDTGYPGGVNNPEQALAYMEWLKTQPATRSIPLYDQEGNVVGQFGISNPVAENASQVSVQASVTVYPECHVDGCNTVGQHIHNGETYCNVSIPVACPSEAIDQNVSTGHHQESHHGSNHH